MPEGVQNSHAEGKKSHEEEIGENDPVERNRQLKCFRIFNVPPWCDDTDQKG